MLPLFAQYPQLKDSVPHAPLGQFPTPVRRLDNLGKEIGADLYLKDDGLSGPLYGGNKVRKLEFLLGDAARRGAKEVLTFGFAGSNHALATAIYARQLGLTCACVLLAQPNAAYVRSNLLLSHASGAEIRYYKHRAAAYAPTILSLIRRTVEAGKTPYVIPPGGSSPLGALGYVNAAFELKEQATQGLIPEPDRLFVALGSMGTAVGLTIGLKAAGMKTRVVGVRVIDGRYASVRGFMGLMRRTLAFIRARDPSFPHITITEGDFDVSHDFFGGQYGRFTAEGMAAVELAARTEGIPLEGTYTGKALAALIAEASIRRSGNDVYLFWNTHNGRDLSASAATVDYRRLPKSVHCYFEEDVQELDRR